MVLFCWLQIHHCPFCTGFVTLFQFYIFFSSPFISCPFCCWWKRSLENKFPVFKIGAFGSLRFDLCTRTLFSHLGVLLLPLLARHGCGKTKGRWGLWPFSCGYACSCCGWRPNLPEGVRESPSQMPVSWFVAFNSFWLSKNSFVLNLGPCW